MQGKYFFLVFGLLLGLALADRASPATQIAAVQGLIGRIIPAYANQFSLSIISDPNHDSFEISSNGSMIAISGTSGVALASGLNWYLKYYCNVFWSSWSNINSSGIQMIMPAVLPNITVPVSVQIPVKWRYYMNVCTVSYSAVWWDWQRWQMEIDWMALNGINLPLAFTGQEYVWAQLWAELGLEPDEYEFSGPAFLAWQRMGNLRNWASPLYDSWITGQAQLQRQSLALMRSYGMTPVLPCFAGHIPQAIGKIFPNANITLSAKWAGFVSLYGDTYLLQPDDPLFPKIASRFIELVTAAYGTDHIYNCDTFNEMDPATPDPTYLAASSAAVIEGMKQADPEAVWLMQGWLFQSSFWNANTTQAYLSGVSNSDMIILDLFAEAQPIWSRTNSFYGKPFIWCMLHNFGGNRGIYGNLTSLSVDPLSALHAPNSTMIGTGLTMEAIEQNPVVYEFMAEMGLRATPPSVDSWVKSWARRRYGADSASAKAAWEILSKTQYYGEYNQYYKPPLELSPGLKMGRNWQNGTSMVQVVRLMLAASQETPISGPYEYDLVDFTRQMLVNLHSDMYYQLDTMWGNGTPMKPSDVVTIGVAMQELVSFIDQLLQTNPNTLLGVWLANAAKFANSSDEVALYQFNARNQLTLWGPEGEIDDYAAKEWSGLVSGYYSARWSLFLQALYNVSRGVGTYNQSVMDEMELELGQQWCNVTDRSAYPAIPTGDTLVIVTQIVQKFATAPSPATYTSSANSMPASGSKPIVVAMTTDTPQLMYLCSANPLCVGFTSDGKLYSSVTSVVSQNGMTYYAKK